MNVTIEGGSLFKEKLLIPFVDLKKAYHSVLRQALWRVLRKLGIPDTLLSLIVSFHQEMQARIWLEGKLMDREERSEGQGCCMAPVLFNLFMCAVVVRACEADEVG